MHRLKEQLQAFEEFSGGRIVPLRRSVNRILAAGGRDDPPCSVAPQDVLDFLKSPDATVVCALDDQPYLIRGSVSRADFEKRPPVSAIVIVYCSSWSCPAGKHYAEKIRKIHKGLLVLDYVGGLGEWAMLRLCGHPEYAFSRADSDETVEDDAIVRSQVLAKHSHQYYRRSNNAASFRARQRVVSSPPKARHCIAIIDMNGVTGHIKFSGSGDRACETIEFSFQGLTKGAHGLHIHRCGDLSRGCASACDHFNPLNQDHGAAHGTVRHAGDLGNVVADERGTCSGTITNVQDISCSPTSDFSILGRMVVIHAQEDDLGLGGDEESKKTGNAGERIACGVIGRM